MLCHFCPAYSSWPRQAALPPLPQSSVFPASLMLSGTRRAGGRGCSRLSAPRSLQSGTGHGSNPRPLTDRSSPGGAPPSPPTPAVPAIRARRSAPPALHGPVRIPVPVPAPPLTRTGRAPPPSTARCGPAAPTPARPARRPAVVRRARGGSAVPRSAPAPAAAARRARAPSPLPPPPSLVHGVNIRPPAARALCRRHGGPLPPTGPPLCAPPSWRRRGLRLLPGRTRVARAPPRAEVRGAAPEVSSAHAHCRWRRRETRWYRRRAGRGAERSLGRDAAGDHHPAAGPVRQPE